MGLETTTYINGLVATNPTAGDPVSQGDDHVRLLKAAILATFPNINGAVTPTPTQVNRLTGSNHLVVDRAYGSYTTNADIATVIPNDDTIPQSTEGTQILSVSITPKTTTNRVRVRVQGMFSNSAASNGIMALFNGGAGAIAAVAQAVPSANVPGQLVLEHEYVPGATAAITFTVRVGPSSGTLRMNGATTGRLFGGVAATTIVVEEITAS